MCLSCGCDMPYDKMSSHDNITVDDIKKAAVTDDGKGQTTDQIVKNIVETWKRVKDEDKNFKAQ